MKVKTDGVLVVELPESVIQDLRLEEGDDVQVRVAGLNKVEVEKPLTREEAMKRLKEISLPLPPDYKFNREELYER